jgi:hypothetical protein
VHLGLGEGDVGARLVDAACGDVDQILGIQTLNYAKKTSSGSRAITTVVKSGGTEYDSDTIGLPDTYLYKKNIFGVDPDTGDPWTAAGFNAAQFGPKVIV